jgi:hypothetical protein
MPQYKNVYPTENYHGNQHSQQASTHYVTSQNPSQHYRYNAHQSTQDYPYKGKSYGGAKVHVPRHNTYDQTDQKEKNSLEYNKRLSYGNSASYDFNAKSVRRFGTPQKKKFYWPYYPYSASDYGNPLHVRSNQYKQGTQTTYSGSTEYHGNGQFNDNTDYGDLVAV